MSVATPGTFTPGSGTIEYTGAAPAVRATNYHNLAIQCGAGRTATLGGNASLTGSLTVASGTLNLGAYTADRPTSGGTLTVGANAGLTVAGAANFPSNYATVSLDPASTVAFSHAGDQAVNALSYGHLVLGGSGVKSLASGTAVAGNLSIAPTGTAVASLEDGLNLAVASLSLGGFGRIGGTWGSSASDATYRDDAYFGLTTGKLTVNADSRTTARLTVAGSPAAYGTPVPAGYGEGGDLVCGLPVTNGVESSLMVEGFAWRNAGWTLTKTDGGALVSNGTANPAVFLLTTNLTLTWQWESLWLSIGGSPSAYGEPGPLAYGSYSNIGSGVWITNAVGSPVNEAAGRRNACIGWGLAATNGTAVDSGTGTQAVFQTGSECLILMWYWTNEYLLATLTNGNGTVTADTWHIEDSTAQIEATAGEGSVFLQWTGDVPAGSHTNNPLTVTMDKPRSITAQFASGSPVTRTWTGNGSWFSATNWNPQGVPGTGDVLFIESGSCTLAEPAWAGSLTVSNATLTFTNWTTVLTAAGDILIRNKGNLTTPTNAVRSALSNRVHLVCAGLTIEPGGQINVDARGYGGGWESVGVGPGASTTYSVGLLTYPGAGSYGGKGGDLITGGSWRSGSVYGNAYEPTGPGSGGGSQDPRTGYQGGNGGGAVRIQAGGHVLLNGVVTANAGAGGTSGSPGSGGAIWIACQTLGGTGGVVQANGVSGVKGGGGGGRIAIHYDPVQQALQPAPGVVFSARGGKTVATGQFCDGDLGTLYMTDRALLGPVITHSGMLFFGEGDWAGYDSLVVSNGWVRFPDGDYAYTVTNDILVTATGRLDIGGNQYYTYAGVWRNLSLSNTVASLQVGGDVLLTNGGQMAFVPVSTNGVAGPIGLPVAIAGRLEIAPSSWVFLMSSPANGGSVSLTCSDLVIATNAGIDADASGFAGGRNSSGLGYGASRYSGGGYGGRGGSNVLSAARGPVYGASNFVIHCGSGGGGGDNNARYHSSAGYGGGLIRIAAANEIRVDGFLTANGDSAAENYSSGGSGGGIFLSCLRFSGAATGRIRANGGPSSSSWGGGGGGGRIHIRRFASRDSYAGQFSVAGAAGLTQAGEAGSLFLENLRGAGGALLIVR
jgi:hypothetical protein